MKSFLLLPFLLLPILCHPTIPSPPPSNETFTFKQVIAEPAPLVPSNLAVYCYALDIYLPTTLAQMQYVWQNNYATVFVRAYTPAGQGAFDPNVCNTITCAQRAGLGVEVYMTPQPNSNKQGYQQVDEVYQGLLNCGFKINAIWIQVTSPSNWNPCPNCNINFISSMVNRARQYHFTVGIYTNQYDWQQITNNACMADDVLLWYWNVYGSGVNGETAPNFNDFRPFACWKYPTVKQFAQVETVGTLQKVNRDVYIQSGSTAVEDMKDDGKVVIGHGVMP